MQAHLKTCKLLQKHPFRGVLRKRCCESRHSLKSEPETRHPATQDLRPRDLRLGTLELGPWDLGLAILGHGTLGPLTLGLPTDPHHRLHYLYL